MAKRESDVYITKDFPNGEGEARAPTGVHPQVNQKATPAQLAQRNSIMSTPLDVDMPDEKSSLSSNLVRPMDVDEDIDMENLEKLILGIRIREAKGRRRAGNSPSPKPSPLSALPQNQSNVFGAFGINATQQQAQAQPNTIGGSSGFTHQPTIANNPFGNPAPALLPPAQTSFTPSFGQSFSVGGNQSSMFSPAPTSQPGSNPFGNASNSFLFRKSPETNNTPLPTSNTSSIFEKSAPAANSFNLGSMSQSSLSNSTFGGPSQSPVAKSSEKMDTSGDSPYKGQSVFGAMAKPAQNLAPPTFGAPNSFSSASAESPVIAATATSGPPNPFGQSFQPTQKIFGGASPTTQQPFSGASPPTQPMFGGTSQPTQQLFGGASQPMQPMFGSTSQPTQQSFVGAFQPATPSAFGLAGTNSNSLSKPSPPQPSASNFSFVSKPTETEQQNATRPNAPAFSSAFNPFSPAIPAKNGNLQGAEDANLSGGGTFNGMGQIGGRLASGSNDNADTPSPFPIDPKLTANSIQSSPPVNPFQFTPVQPPTAAGGEVKHTLALLKPSQLAASVEPESLPSVPQVNLFQNVDPVNDEKSRHQTSQPSAIAPPVQFSKSAEVETPIEQYSESPAATPSVPTSNPAATEKAEDQIIGKSATNAFFRAFSSANHAKPEDQTSPSLIGNASATGAEEPARPLFSATKPAETEVLGGRIAEESAANIFSHAIQSAEHENAKDRATRSSDVKGTKGDTGQPANPLFQASKPQSEESFAVTQSSLKRSLGGESEPQTKSVKLSATNGIASPPLTQGRAEPLLTKPSASMSSVNSLKESSLPNSSKPSNDFGGGANNSKKTDVEQDTRRASQTSNLFSRSLQQVSAEKPLNTLQFSHSQASTALVLEANVDDAPSNSIKFKAKSHGPSNVPQGLDSDAYVDYDKMYRLRSLNARLKDQIASLGPTSNDFECAIRFYASQRAAVGYPIGGLYHRAKAGDKRRMESHDQGGASSPAKRARHDSPDTSHHQQAHNPVPSLNAIANSSISLPPSAISSSGADRPPSAINSASAVSKQPEERAMKLNGSIDDDRALSTSHQPSIKSSGNLSTPSPFQSVTFMQKSASSKAPPISSSGASAPTAAGQKEQSSTASVADQTNVNGFGPSSLQAKPAASFTLEVPKFGSPNGVDFMAAFAAKAEKEAARMEAENKAKRKAEDFDSDEDDEEEYDRRAAEEDRAKRAKLREMAKLAPGFTPVLSASASPSLRVSPPIVQSGSSTRDASAEASVTSEQLSGSKSTDEENEDSRDGDYTVEEEFDGEDGHGNGDGAGVSNAEEESDDDNDIQAAMARARKRGKNTAEPASKGRSMFDRVSRPELSSDEKDSKSSGTSPVDQADAKQALSAPPGTGLFGSRPTTPSFGSPALGTSIFDKPTLGSPGVDNTWKPGSAIKFGSSSAPTFSVTLATPSHTMNGGLGDSRSSTFGGDGGSVLFNSKIDGNETSKASTNIFGSGKPATSSVPPFGTGLAGSQINPFGDDSKKTTVNQSSAAQTGFVFGVSDKPGGSALLAPSNPGSVVTSRGTSPNLTDHDSQADSAPEDQANDPQSDYMSSRPGEENEMVVFEARTKVLEFMTASELATAGSKETAGYKTRGLGPLRVLKNLENGRTRIVMRGEPGANVIINAPLIADNKYDVQPSGKEGASIKMGLYQNGKLKSWVLKLKYMSNAQELADFLQKNEPGAKDRQS